MKAAKPAGQIKRFVRLFAGHASQNTPALFFRHCLRRQQERRDIAIPQAGFLTGYNWAIAFMRQNLL
jgi:hypothetical protein